MPHKRAKARLIEIVSTARPPPKMLIEEYQYPNPFSPEFPWRFDVYAELYDGRKIALEVDGAVGHSSKRSHDKREQKILYLKTQGIELYAFPTKFIIGRGMLPSTLFLEELKLV